MSGIFDQFRKKIVSSIWKDSEEAQNDIEVDDLIALGVLLWEVAAADKKFLPEEDDKIKKILKEYSNISDKDMPVVLRAIKEASLQKIDLYTFTREISQDLAYDVKNEIICQLFRVACADKELDHEEHEIIRKISGLLGIDHKDFIESKIKIKKEFGMDTSGL